MNQKENWYKFGINSIQKLLYKTKIIRDNQ